MRREGGGLRVIVCLLPPSHKAMADKCKHGGILTDFQTKVNKKINHGLHRIDTDFVKRLE